MSGDVAVIQFSKTTLWIALMSFLLGLAVPAWLAANKLDVLSAKLDGHFQTLGEKIERLVDKTENFEKTVIREFYRPKPKE